MKRSFLLVSAVVLILGFVTLRLSQTPSPMGSDVDRNSEKITEVRASGPSHRLLSHSSTETKERNSGLDIPISLHQDQSLALNPEAASNEQAKNDPKVNSVNAISPQALLRTLDASGPSIGTVKVIGARGCDTNTQGWYLGKGKPDEYYYSESDDGETIVVQPNVQSLTGAFEFVHCADANQIAGKHIQFRVRLKAQDVQDIALLRFWGENPSRERILFKSEKVTGTYDWKDFVLEADVPSEVTLFNYGITFKNPGKLWISHPVFSVGP